MSITLDGTNGITSPDVVTNDGQVYAKENILGTVSESGGVPTGAIIERGSNANGEFVKYADGTMICFRRQVSLPFVNAVRLTLNINYPATFITNPTGTISLSSSSSVETIGFDTKAGGALVHINDSGSIANLRLYRQPGGSFSSGDTILVDYTAVGRWF